MEARVMRTRRNIGWVAVEASVEGKLACSGELMFSISSDASTLSSDATILHL